MGGGDVPHAEVGQIVKAIFGLVLLAALIAMTASSAVAAPADAIQYAPNDPRRWDRYYSPAKTHDLSVRRGDVNVVITVEGEDDAHQVYLSAGVAKDLGRALDLLTPAQIALLIGELTGDEG